MRQRLPLPFLILILAAIVSLCSLLVSWRSGATAGRQNAVQMQTVEQERMTALYLRVLTWISDVSQKQPEMTPEPPHAHSQPLRAPIPRSILLRAS
jgi:hypothetical protein